MINIMDRLHLALAASLAIEPGRVGRVTSIYNIKEIDYAFRNRLLGITTGTTKKNHFVVITFLIILLVITFLIILLVLLVLLEFSQMKPPVSCVAKMSPAVIDQGNHIFSEGS